MVRDQQRRAALRVHLVRDAECELTMTDPRIEVVLPYLSGDGKQRRARDLDALIDVLDERLWQKE